MKRAGGGQGGTGWAGRGRGGRGKTDTGTGGKGGSGEGNIFRKVADVTGASDERRRERKREGEREGLMAQAGGKVSLRGFRSRLVAGSSGERHANADAAVASCRANVNT